MKTTVSEKGQITIPKQARERLGLGPGVVLEITCEDGRLIATKRDDGNPFERWRGRGKPVAKDTATYLRKIRG
jgi:AbrB family looped-hinge helix DNA binding protein